MIHPLETDYERIERDMLIAMAKPGDVLFDVGAYVGWYSVEFARKVPHSKVYAFEPITENRVELRKNLGNLRNVHIRSFGVSNRYGGASFFSSKREPGTASLAPLEEERFGPLTIETKPVVTLDSCLDCGIPNFIKIDVEGAEFLVLQGAERILRQHRPIILCEMLRKWAKRFDYHPNAIIAYMLGLDYRCETVDGRPFTIMTDDTVEKNFFFYPEEYR